MKNTCFMMGLLCILFLSCSESGENNSTADNTTTDQTTTAIDANDKLNQEQLATITDTAGNSTSVIVYNGTNPTYDWDKKIIKTANVQLECKDYKLYNQQVHTLAKEFGGWIASESEVQHSDRITNSVTIKVPVPQFEDLLASVGNLNAKTIEKRISSEDVTGKIVDVQGRIQVKKEIRDKYLDMLHRTSKIDDALKVQSELNSMHENIEMASTYLATLKNQVAYSTINLSYFQLMEVPVIIAKNNKPGFGERIKIAAINGGSWLLDLAVGLISIWPLLIGFVALVYYLKKKKPFRNTKPIAGG